MEKDMSFTTFEFFLFIAAAVIIYYVIPKKLQWIWLLIISYVYYASYDISTVWMLLLTTYVTYRGGILLDRLNEQKPQDGISREEKKDFKKNIVRKKKKIVLAMVLIAFGMLGIMKYTNFMLGNIDAVLRLFGSGKQIGVLNLTLPLGISFYTFQSISYVVDVYRGKHKAQGNFFKHALFVSFFPQLLQGPIGRYERLGSQLYEGHSYNLKELQFGVQRILWGFFKKMVLADRVNAAVLLIFHNYWNYGGWYNVLGVLLYSIQLYADFSGGIDIVIGIAQMFGITMDENFRQPYFSRSISEFWRRWQQFFAAQLLAAAAGQHGGIGHSLEVGVGRDAQFCKGGGHPDLLDEGRQSLHASLCQFQLGFARRVDAPDVLCKAGEPCGVGREQVTVQHRVNDRQTSTVVAVGVGTQLMLDHVTLEVGDLADFQDAVFGHSRSPCQLAAGLVAVLVSQQDADVADDAAHDGFVDVIGEVVLVRLAEVSFHRVAQGVERTGNDLLHGNGQRVGGVEESKVGLCTPQGPLNLLFLMGDDRAVVHLGAGTEHRDDGAQRDELSGKSMLGVFQLPQIFVHLGLCGHHLAAVGHGTAAHGKDQIHMVLTGQLCTLLHLGVGGIGHDAGKLHDVLTLGVQNTDDFIIDTIVLDRTAAVGQHHGIAVVLQQTAQIFLHATLAEINLGLVFK